MVTLERWSVSSYHPVQAQYHNKILATNQQVKLSKSSSTILTTMSPIASSSSTAPKSIVIVGGGIIGVCTAYYTSISPRFQPAKGDSITLVEATDVASAASGKAGGLLALDWHGQATASESAPAWWQRNRRMRRRMEADERHPN